MADVRLDPFGFVLNIHGIFDDFDSGAAILEEPLPHEGTLSLSGTVPGLSVWETAIPINAAQLGSVFYSTGGGLDFGVLHLRAVFGQPYQVTRSASNSLGLPPEFSGLVDFQSGQDEIVIGLSIGGARAGVRGTENIGPPRPLTRDEAGGPGADTAVAYEFDADASFQWSLM